MIDVLIVAAAACITIVALFVVVPWVGRQIATALLFGVRDELFVATHAQPELRDTRIYRDMEFLTAVALHTTRKRSVADAARFFRVLSQDRPQRTVEQEVAAAKRLEVYNAERESAFADHPEVLDALYGVVGKLRTPLVIRIICAHPLAWIAFAAGFAVAVVKDVGASALRGPVNATASAVSAIESLAASGPTQRPPHAFV